MLNKNGEKMKSRIALTSILFLFLIQIYVYAQGKRAFTAEDLWNLKRLSGLTVSPDGKFGCFVVTEYNIKETYY
jgi:hypothetical protein